MATVSENPSPLLTIDEYVHLPDDRRKTELVRGKVVEVPLIYPYVGYVCARIGHVIGSFVDERSLGSVIGNDSGIITGRDPDTVRGADLCFYTYQRLPAGPLPIDRYLTAMPDLIVEVRDPRERQSQLLGKVSEYLTAGVTAVCVVNPEAGTAIVYRDNQDPESFAADAELTLPDVVLPGFRVPLRQFFE